ncbi:DUF2255 family protein [Streptomyces sp. NBC_00669]|uniref:DUF2255 family protein n=1 Tax=Streptomyces sp. NBC_00669 TaxID=2976011 RepID=UPI002E326212|nr:DUF2255 family protein [Streptomyces sp. NBC_00669]
MSRAAAARFQARTSIRLPGPSSRWFRATQERHRGAVRLDGTVRQVAFDVPAWTDARLTRAIDDAYARKYGDVGAMSDRMRAATVRIAPLGDGRAGADAVAAG